MQIYRLEGKNSHSAGGILFVTPTGKKLSVEWQSTSQIHDTLTMAKECATQLLDKMLSAGYVDDADRTNWPSVVAACQHHVRGFNAQLQKAQHEPQNALPDPQNHR